jgi:hypothetical protein
MNLAALNSMPARNHGAVAAIITAMGGLGATFGVAVSGAVFESLQIERTVGAAAARGVQLSHDAARAVEAVLDGSQAATRALANYPAAQHAALVASVREGFVSALGTTLELSFVVLLAGIAFALALIRGEASQQPALARPNMTEPFSGLAPRP